MTDQRAESAAGVPAGTDGSPDGVRAGGVRLVDAFYRALQTKDIDAFAALWTADAVYRIPVTPAGVPGEFAGRDTIVGALGQFFALFDEVRITWDAEPMADPEKLLATWTLEIELVGGGTYRNRGVSIFRLEGDRIAEFSEHVDTAAFLGIFAAKVGVARRFFELLHDKDIDAWGELWHERAAITVPYAPEGFPSLIEGRDEIVAAYRKLFPSFETFDVELTGVHPAVNSDAICVEYRIHARLVNGAAYTNDSVAVFRFEDGLISAFHDYFDPRPFQDVIGGLAAGKAD